MDKLSFGNTAIVACGTLSPEINYLVKQGFLDTRHIFYTTPGLHQDISELETQLKKFIEKAKAVANGVIVVYGGKYCYVNPDNPTRLMKTIIEEQGLKVTRIEATHCMGMLASEEEMKQITNELAGGEPVWFMTPGWVKFVHRYSRAGTKGLPMRIFQDIQGVPLFWTVLDIWTGTWRKIRRNFLNIVTGWESPCRHTPLPWTGSKAF